jgi:hypothetical protein
MSTKTIYKRIALVAVASLGAGLLSVAPANATAAAAVPSAGAVVVASSTNIGTEATSNTFVSRTSFSSGILAGTVTSADDKFFSAYLTNSAADTIITLANGGLSALTGTDDAATPSVKTGVVSATGSGIFELPATSSSSDQYTNYSATFGDLAAGTYKLYFDADSTLGSGVLVGTLRVVDAAAPKSVSFTTGSVTQLEAAGVDYDATFTVKDANGATTVLVNSEKVVFDVTPVTGVSTTTVVMNDDQTTIDKADAVSTTNVYKAGINGDGSTDPASTGVTIAGTEYTVTATLQDGSTALAAPVAFKYKRLSNTSGLAGSLTFTSDSAGLKPITTLSTSSGVATPDFYVVAKDANGGRIINATVAFTASTGAVTTAGIVTGVSGVTSNNTATPSAAGTQTITATIATGAATITAALAVTAAAGSALAASANNWMVVKGNGTGVVVTSTAPDMKDWDTSLNVSSITATLSGLTPSSAVKLTVGGNAGTPTVNAVTGTIYPIADATGKVSVTLAPSGTPTAGQNITLAADSFVGGSYGGTDTTLTITYRAIAPEVTTSPLTASLNMATPSTTQSITATHTDQFGNAVTGGFMTLTNTVAPSGVTAQTAVTVGTDATGKATLSAILGSVLGTYTYTVQPKNSNGDNAGTASTISYAVTTTGIAATLVLTDNDTPSATVTTTDDKSTREINVAPAVLQAIGGGVTTNITEITVATTSPAGLGFTATATNGIRLFTTNPNSAVIGVGKTSVTGVAGTTSIFAVPTKVGTGTITVVSGGLTKVFTLTGALAVTVKKAQIVTLTAATAAGQYVVKITDIFGNGVVSDVAISLSGPGAFSNGFKNLSVTTGADGTNTFNVVSDGSAATTITAVVPDANYQAITATEATTSALTGGLGTDGATTATATATLAGKGGDATGTATATSLAALTTLINSLIAKINALNKLVIKIQKKVRA